MFLAFGSKSLKKKVKSHEAKKNSKKIEPGPRFPIFCCLLVLVFWFLVSWCLVKEIAKDSRSLACVNSCVIENPYSI